MVSLATRVIGKVDYEHYITGGKHRFLSLTR